MPGLSTRRTATKKTCLAVLVLAVVVAACGRPTGESGSGGRALIQNKGSDTLVNVAQAWAENYKEVDPNVAVAVTGGGSGNGIDPIEWVVGFDALAVFVHLDNPVEGFSLSQLAEICGEGGDCVAPSMATAIDRSYPVARPLFMYTAGQPEGAIKEYLGS